MKCPLLKITRPGLMTAAENPQVECIKEECAWWDNQDKRCILVTIAGCLKTHLGWMGDLVDKMPIGWTPRG